MLDESFGTPTVLYRQLQLYRPDMSTLRIECAQSRCVLVALAVAEAIHLRHRRAARRGQRVRLDRERPVPKRSPSRTTHVDNLVAGLERRRRLS